ncbi:MAG: hypothetical protein ACE5EY_05770 [Anaerolineae bacterium]
MAKSPEVELVQLKTAVHYFIGLLNEGTLLNRFDSATREGLATILELLLQKVEGLPAEIPENLVQATAIRAIVDAADRNPETEQDGRAETLHRHMSQAEAKASINGHTLGDWEKVEGSDNEYQATCQGCGGFVYVSHLDIYDLLLPDCERT